MKVSDYIVDFLVQRGTSDIFMVSGGGIMHLVESVGSHAGMRYVCNHHEQACAIAAESYAQVKQKVGACLVTTGPGATNALAGIVGSWTDSVPTITICGQVRRDLIADYAKLRQLGPQELNIVDMARPVTKYVTLVNEPTRIRYELERAFAAATSGRPGPVLVAVPLDVQGANVDELSLPGYDNADAADYRPRPEQVRQAIEMLKAAKRPVLIISSGIHRAQAEELFLRFMKKVKVPTMLAIGGMDLVGETDEFYQGKFGSLGQRRGNFALQNSDLVLTLGASMSVACVGFNTTGLAPKARRIMVNIDAGELAKPTYRADLPIHADVKLFMEAFLCETESIDFQPSEKWREACQRWKQRYPILTPDYYEDKQHVNSYVFTSELSDLLGPDAVVVTGNSLDAWSVYQTFKVKRGQKVFTNVNCGSMGWDLPAAVGASVAQGNRRTILITGDGSFQFNIQELLTISHNRLDVKIFILNNRGYASIRGTQTGFFKGHFVGSDASSGISNPNYAKIAAAYGLGYDRIETNDQIRSKTATFLATSGPALCELNIAFAQERRPRISSVRREDGTMESRPLEDMYPFLPREEILENMRTINAD
ncbi:MAG: thiamine pyrophosphate-binding protein [Verrucomicrobiota bacterium]|jgi:acetolactate synthase-1/2/3 large subunit